MVATAALLATTAFLSAPAQDLTLPPESAATVAILEGRGVQIYTCAAQPGGYGWLFKAPEAQLFNLATGKPAGHHDAGPSWTLEDGSSVRGALLHNKPGSTPADVPWLLLTATPAPSTAPGTPPGTLSNVTYVRRYNTHGGTAPAAGCEGAQIGQILRVPYTATYAFYATPGTHSDLQTAPTTPAPAPPPPAAPPPAPPPPPPPPPPPQ